LNDENEEEDDQTNRDITRELDGRDSREESDDEDDKDILFIVAVRLPPA
jgi:hypothetical protein